MRNFSLFILSMFILTGCQKAEISPQDIVKAIEKDPVLIMTALQKASQAAQEQVEKKKAVDEKLALESTFSTPLQPQIRSDELILGPADAPITLVEYSDFECSFCARGFTTVKSLMTKYPGKVRFIYKHLPLSFHPQAMISAQYYEALRIQDGKKAIQFHDEIFANQGALRNGEAFLKQVVKKIGADQKRITKDIASAAVNERIESDTKEAGTLGFQGTPGFLLNGIPVKGAYPVEHFDGIIAELQKRGTLKL
ncbi:MAG: thioredoxin domain-containing protein [Bdellovibrionota bacterium]